MKFNLEERLINFAVLILEITEKLPESKGSNHLLGQLVDLEQRQLYNMAKRNRLNLEKILFTK